MAAATTAKHWQQLIAAARCSLRGGKRRLGERIRNGDGKKKPKRRRGRLLGFWYAFLHIPLLYITNKLFRLPTICLTTHLHHGHKCRINRHNHNIGRQGRRLKDGPPTTRQCAGPNDGKSFLSFISSFRGSKLPVTD